MRARARTYVYSKKYYYYLYNILYMDNEHYILIIQESAGRVNFVGIVYTYMLYIWGPEGLNHTVKVRATITADRCETREMPRHQMAHDRCNLIPPAPGAFAFGVYLSIMYMCFILSKTPVLFSLCACVCVFLKV